MWTAGAVSESRRGDADRTGFSCEPQGRRQHTGEGRGSPKYCLTRDDSIGVQHRNPEDGGDSNVNLAAALIVFNRGFTSTNASNRSRPVRARTGLVSSRRAVELKVTTYYVCELRTKRRWS